jgi:hypothetical protein
MLSPLLTGRVTDPLAGPEDDWDEDVRLAYRERLAIVSLDGRIPLARAEEIAAACVRSEAARGTLGRLSPICATGVAPGSSRVVPAPTRAAQPREMSRKRRAVSR